MCDAAAAAPSCRETNAPGAVIMLNAHKQERARWRQEAGPRPATQRHKVFKGLDAAVGDARRGRGARTELLQPRFPGGYSNFIIMKGKTLKRREKTSCPEGRSWRIKRRRPRCRFKTSAPLGALWADSAFETFVLPWSKV